MAALIVAGVTSLGFTSQGIAAGSFAAWLMSVCGPVASGSIVAICQSIGATGAVSATTAAIANTTAAVTVGGAVVKVARSINRSLKKDHSDRGGPKLHLQLAATKRQIPKMSNLVSISI